MVGGTVVVVNGWDTLTKDLSGKLIIKCSLL